MAQNDMFDDDEALSEEEKRLIVRDSLDHLKRKNRRHCLKYFLVGSVVGCIICMFITSCWPLPIPDRGHRLFATRDEHAAAVLGDITTLAGVKPAWTFDAAPTHQMVMNDQRTVLGWFDPGFEGQDAISLAVSNPPEIARRAAEYLKANGFTATIDSPIPDLPDALVRVKTNALLSSVIVFRKPFYRMPSPKERPNPATSQPFSEVQPQTIFHRTFD